MTVRQSLGVVVSTHASSVMPFVSDSHAELAIVTQLDAPLKFSAPPYLPAALHDVPDNVPVCALPLASAVVVPVPSLNP